VIFFLEIVWNLRNNYYFYITNNNNDNQNTKTMTTQITIHPTVKNEIHNSFGVNPLSELMIKTYEGVYNLALSNNKSLDEGHKIAMASLLELSKLIRATR
jgi:hypothetical protein